MCHLPRSGFPFPPAQRAARAGGVAFVATAGAAAARAGGGLAAGDGATTVVDFGGGLTFGHAGGGGAGGEQQSGDASVSNPAEAATLARIIGSLVGHGGGGDVLPSDIAVIATYNKQVAAIREVRPSELSAPYGAGRIWDGWSLASLNNDDSRNKKEPRRRT